MLPLLLQSVVLHGATVHSMVPGEPPRRATIVLADRHITAVTPAGEEVAAPEDAERVDVGGLHVIPGLIDALVQHDPDHDRLYVTGGVTLVRDTGNDLLQILAERDRDRQTGARDRGPGPAILCAGGVLDGAPPSAASAIVLTTPEEAADKIPRLLELEPDFLSFHSGLKAPVWRRVLELARAARRTVWGPLPAGVSLPELAAAGQDGLYHLEAFLPPGRDWASVTARELEERARLLEGTRVAVTPTLGVFAQRLLLPAEKAPELEYLGPIYVAQWLGEAGLRSTLVNEEYQRTGLRVVAEQKRLVALLHARGVRLVPGTGSPNPWLFPGESLVDELEMWASAGIPRAEVLRLATASAADALGVGQERGTIAPGRIGDLVVLPADPTLDLGVLRRPEMVVLRGRVLRRDVLEALRADLSRTQKALQAQAFQALGVAEPSLPIGEVLLRGTAEKRVLGQRVSGERFAVVRTYDKSLVFCSRVVTPGTASVAGSEVLAQQAVRGGDLVGFDVKLRSAGREASLVGTRVGNLMNVERRLDGVFEGNFPVKDRLALVDVGSVATELMLGQRASAGPLNVIFLEDLDPAVGRWELRIGDDGVRWVKTHQGVLRTAFGADGAPRDAVRERGRQAVATQVLDFAAENGGLPLPAGPSAGKAVPVPAGGQR